ncbi:exosortase [Sulfurifustis variabilis]|uniref:Exosortase n=1 Tax=Sulfurifustis variabilis TaxID=1675686 RepID=A0A1C7AFS7_9GAMM|nr:exosortase Q [Sulfurifustis variabilis]BAU50246.1 exosortase [Sulfurifustis variabilis]
MNLAARVAWVDRLPAGLWLILPVVALTPVWLWSAARLLDRSDDPLGVVALAALAALVARDRDRFSRRPRAGWLVVTTLLAAAAILGGGALPPLARGVLAVLAVCATMMAVRVPAQPMLALTGLALLALPLLSSLQFFVGYPLRVITAEASRLLLAAHGVDVMREGSTLAIAGTVVMVDAPCSGIQMGWVAYFTACAAAAWLRLPDGRFLRRVPLVGVTVLAGNILRNTVLVVSEAGLVRWPDWTHEAIGVAAFAVVCLLVLWQVSAAARAPVVTWEVRLLNHPVRPVSAGTWARLFAFVMLTGLTFWPWLAPQPVIAAAAPPAIEWPRELDGRPLRPLALSAVEQRFADRFPGAIARFTDGEGAIVLRHVTAPTRMLHPAVDCYRGLGYRVGSDTLERAGDRRSGVPPTLWRCLVAEKNGRRLRVCERIVDAHGRGFTDTSAWYWAAVTGRSHGPWRAVTTARML